MIRRVLLATAITGVLVMADSAGAQNLTYARGQNVSPAYEGWEEDSAGRGGHDLFLRCEKCRRLAGQDYIRSIPAESPCETPAFRLRIAYE